MNTTTTSTANWMGWFFSDPLFFVPINVINLILSVPLTTYVIFLLLSSGSGEIDTEIFILNQAVFEIIFSLMGPFLSMCNASIGLCFFKPLGFIIGLCMSARPVFHCCVCLERYLAVVRPVIFLKYKPLRYRVMHSLASWTYILLWGITCMLMYPYMPYVVFSALYLLILAVEFFCCMSILRKLSHPGPGDRARQEREMNSFKKKAIQMIIVSLLTYCFQVIPTIIIFSFQNRDNLVYFTKTVGVIMVVNLIVGFVQPIFVLQKAGKLTLLMSVCFTKYRTPQTN